MFVCDVDADECIKLRSKARPGVSFHVGRFSTPSVAELRAEILEKTKEGNTVLVDSSASSSAGEQTQNGITFRNIGGNARSLHLDPQNAGAIFQVASQFNLLEMVGPNVRPQDGISRYFADKTQGPVCAVACPAGTVFRNYFYNGSGQAVEQFDGAGDIARLVGNARHHYWTMRNGYMLPTKMGVLEGLNQRFASDESIRMSHNEAGPESKSAGLEKATKGTEADFIPLRDAVVASLRVGIHWDVEVERSHASPERAPHRVCQVYSSAVPVNYTKTVATSKQWEPLARAILEGTYESVLSAGAMIWLKRGREGRVKIYLTCVGGGAFGNRTLWIADAMEKALKKFQEFPLDVCLVHYMRNVTQASNPFVKIQRKFSRREKKASASNGRQVAKK